MLMLLYYESNISTNEQVSIFIYYDYIDTAFLKQLFYL